MLFFGNAPIRSDPVPRVDLVPDTIDTASAIKVAVCHPRSNLRDAMAGRAFCHTSEGDGAGTASELGEQLLGPVLRLWILPYIYKQLDPLLLMRYDRQKIYIYIYICERQRADRESFT